MRTFVDILLVFMVAALLLVVAIVVADLLTDHAIWQHGAAKL